MFLQGELYPWPATCHPPRRLTGLRLNRHLESTNRSGWPWRHPCYHKSQYTTEVSSHCDKDDVRVFISCSLHVHLMFIIFYASVQCREIPGLKKIALQDLRIALWCFMYNSGWSAQRCRELNSQIDFQPGDTCIAWLPTIWPQPAT